MRVAEVYDCYWHQPIHISSLFVLQQRLLLEAPTERRPRLQESRTDRSANEFI